MDDNKNLTEIEAQHAENIEAECAIDVVSSENHRPGELYFVLFLFVLTTCFFVDTLKYPGIINGNLDAPSTIPQIFLICMFLLLGLVTVDVLKKQNKDQTFKGILGYLANKNSLILLGMLLLYAVIIPILHFTVATIIFLFLTFFLLDKTKPIKKAIIAIGFTGGVLLIFKILMRVVLP